MLNAISLKCPNCGGALQISPEMITFACGYCGASQMVERSGGTISLHLLTESISKVQAGTDKTAAELAIRRLKEEFDGLQIAEHNLTQNQRKEKFATSDRYKWISVGASCVCAAVGIGIGGWIGMLVIIVWIVLLITILNAYTKEIKEIDSRYAEVRAGIIQQGDDTQRRIEENKAIVGY